MIYKILSKLERKCAELQGKGWGANTNIDEVNRLLKFIDNPKLAIDIGSNIGEYSERLKKKFTDVEIHLFEPSLLNYNKLNKRFGGTESIIINNMAVSNDNGFAELFSDKEGSVLASLTKRKLDHFGITFETSEKVKTIKFETYWESKLKSRDIDLVKIDVEGNELEVLKGMGKAIDKIKLIQFEFGGCNIDTKTYFQDFWYFFKEHNYKIYRITPFGINHVSYYNESAEFFSTTNYICIKS